VGSANYIAAAFLYEARGLTAKVPDPNSLQDSVSRSKKTLCADCCIAAWPACLAVTDDSQAVASGCVKDAR
jgi:hypothetical protein